MASILASQLMFGPKIWSAPTIPSSRKADAVDHNTLRSSAACKIRAPKPTPHHRQLLDHRDAARGLMTDSILKSTRPDGALVMRLR
jgi:hypothetical protein